MAQGFFRTRSINLLKCVFLLPRHSTTLAVAVLQTEAGLVSLCHFSSCVWVNQVVMDEGFKRVVMAVARVPNPITPIKHRNKISCTIVHCLTGEAEQVPTK